MTMNKAHSLTPAQARIASALDRGEEIWESSVGAGYFRRLQMGAIASENRAVIDRMRERGFIAPTNERKSNGGIILGLTDAGRDALTRHRGDEA